MKTGNRRVILHLLCSFLITAAMFVKIQVIPFTGGDTLLAANLAKLRDSFAVSSGKDLVIFAAAFGLLRYAYGRKIVHHGFLTALSGVFAVLYVLSLSAKELGSSDFIFGSAYQLMIAAVVIVGYWLFFDVLLELLYSRAETAPEGLSSAPLRAKRLWLIAFGAILLCRLPWLLGEYPATFSLDAYCQIREWFGLDKWTTHMPPFSTAVEGLCISLGGLAGSRSFGMFLYILMQTAAGAAVFAGSIVLLRQMGCSREGCIATLLFACLAPLWGAYSQKFEKDYLHAVVYALCILLSVKALYKKECTAPQAAGIALSAAAAALIRNNTKYELVPFLLLLCLCFRGKDRKRVAAAAIGTLAVIALTSRVLFPALEIEKGSVREALSIPFQQTARYVKLHGDEVTESERAAIDQVLVYDTLAEAYSPGISDPVKAGYREDASKLPEYFKVWFEMFLKHPRTYFDALLCKSYGYISPVVPCTDARTGGEPEWLVKRHAELGIEKQSRSALSEILQIYNQTFDRMPALNLLSTAGFYFWSMMACAVFLIVKKKLQSTVVFVPAAMNMLTCIASPLYASVRYNLWLPAAAPLLIGWTLYSLRENETPREEIIQSESV